MATAAGSTIAEAGGRTMARLAGNCARRPARTRTQLFVAAWMHC